MWASAEVPLIMMHKVRLQVNTMTAAEKEISRGPTVSPPKLGELRTPS
jgi:hypothetical protein